MLLVLVGALSRTAFSIRGFLRSVCSPTEATRLYVERTVSFSIGEPCFATGIELERGSFYRFTVKGTVWTDGGASADPNGLSSKIDVLKLQPFILHRRHIRQPWLKLMGSVGPNGRETFAIGSGPTFYRAKADGELFLYVNDAVLGVPCGRRWAWPYYWSIGENKGMATVTVSPNP